MSTFTVMPTTLAIAPAIFFGSPAMTETASGGHNFHATIPATTPVIGPTASAIQFFHSAQPSTAVMIAVSVAMRRCECSSALSMCCVQPGGFTEPSLSGHVSNAMPAPLVVTMPPTRMSAKVSAT